MTEPAPSAVCMLTVRVTPRGGRDAVMGVRVDDNVLLLRVAAPPVDGAANRACIELIASALGIRRSHVTLVGGETSRDKRFRIEGLSEADKDARINQFVISRLEEHIVRQSQK